MRVAFILVVAGAALVGCARQDKLEPAATASAAGPARNCINPRFISGQRAAGPSALIFELGGGTVYRNDLPAPCPGLRRPNQSYAFRFDIDEGAALCRNDSFRAFDPVEAKAVGTQAFAQCRLGQFTPVTLPPRNAGR